MLSEGWYPITVWRRGEWFIMQSCAHGGRQAGANRN